MNSLTAFTEVNARYAVISWEPVAGSAERINVAAITDHDGQISGRVLIREEILRCMYGSFGEGIYRLIDSTVEALIAVGHRDGLEAALNSIPVRSLVATKIRLSSVRDENDLFRQIVLLNSSLSVLADEPAPSIDDLPTPEGEVNRQWTTRVKETIQTMRPDLGVYFNREAVLVEGGLPVRFAVLTTRLAAHFGLLRPTQQSQGMEDARAKLWKLALAKERNPALASALIFGTPTEDDILISDRQRDRLKLNVTEIRQEAASRQVTLREVHTVNDAAEAIVEIA